MYTPILPGHFSARTTLPHMPKTRPTSLYPNSSCSSSNGAPLVKQPSASVSSSKASKGKPWTRSQETPLQPVRPAVAAVDQHQNDKKQQRYSRLRSRNSYGSYGSSGKEHHPREKHDKDKKYANNSSSKASLLAASNSTGASIRVADDIGTDTAGTASTTNRYPTFSYHHRDNLQTTFSSPKQGQQSQQSQSALRRASYSFISRGRRRDRNKAVVSPDERKHAHAHAQLPTSSAWPSVAAHMTGAAPISSVDTCAHSGVERNMSSTTEASSNSGEKLISSKPFVIRNGRSYFNDTSLPYPLPADLTELHRQSMRTLLLIQVFGGPVCSPVFSKRPPQHVLEIGCGSGFWSMMCHRFFKSRGHANISFTGIDISPLAPTGPTINTCSSNSSNGGNGGGDAASAAKPDVEMKWRFISHDLRQLPWPMDSEEFDLIMVKDMSLATTNLQHQDFVDEYIRLLRPGGVLEIWESDHLIRMLRPHVPDAKLCGEEHEDQEAAASLGAYVMNANTPLSAPLNGFLIEYNQWLSRALETRDLTALPCTLIGPTLLQESEALADVRSRRLAIPLSEVRWEREGVGGVIAKNGKLTAGAGAGAGAGAKDKTTLCPRENRVLSAGQEAVRQTALLTVVQQVQALEPMLREVSGKSQDEWDVWLGKMMGDLMSDGGTSWGECLEVGAWSATKRNR